MASAPPTNFSPITTTTPSISTASADSLIAGLLSSSPPLQLQRYKLYLQFHLKSLLTHLSKYRIESDTKPKLHFYSCKQSCYSSLSPSQSSLFTPLQKQYLRSCVDQCKAPMTSLTEYLDDINYLSNKKLKECRAKCWKAPVGMDQDSYKSLCLWECWNKLDRRYVKYWMEKRNKVLRKHKLEEDGKEVEEGKKE